MNEISESLFVVLIKNKFEDFIPYWNAYINNWGDESEVIFQMMPFAEYTIDLIKKNDMQKVKEVLEFVEFLVCNGCEMVKNAMTTGYLESLMSKDPDEIQFSQIVPYLGKESIAYCRAWDEFTGVRTEGLWDKE